MDFDTEFDNSDIRYELRATVNGELAGKISDYDLDTVIAKSHQLEGEVAQLVESNLQDKIDNAREEFEMREVEV